MKRKSKAAKKQAKRRLRAIEMIEYAHKRSEGNELREKVIDCLVENNESIQNNYEHRYELLQDEQSSYLSRLLVNNELLKFEQELTKSISKKTILFSFVKAAQLSDKVTKD